MLAKILAAASLCAWTPPALAAAFQIPVRPPAPRATLQPTGSFDGAWMSGSLLIDGVLSGVLIDSAGTPLWMMNAELSLTGEVVGDLTPMAYLGNPAATMGDLGVLGQAQLDADGSGTFNLVMHQELGPVGGKLAPIYVVGFLDGTLENGRLGGPEALTAGPEVSATSNRSGIGHLPRGGTIYDPHGPSAPIVSIQNVGPHGLAGPPSRPFPPLPAGDQATEDSGGAGGGYTRGSLRRGVVAALTEVQSAGSYGSLGHQIPPNGSGKALGRWYLVTF